MIDTIIAPDKYLSLNLPNCQSAIAYMDSIITPNYTVIGYVKGMPKVVYGSFEILNDTINSYKTNKHLYHINDKCFVGLPSKLMYEVFCPDSMLVPLLKADTTCMKLNKSLPIKFDISGIVGLIFEVENGIVISSRFFPYSSLSN